MEDAVEKSVEEIEVQRETFLQKVLPWAEMAVIVVALTGVMVGGAVLAIYKFWGVSLFWGVL